MIGRSASQGPSHRWSIVARMTLLWALLFTATTGLVVGGTYALVARSVRSPGPENAPVEVVDAIQANLGAEATARFAEVVESARNDVLDTLRRRSIAVFLVGVVCSTLAAWLLARRSIAPVRRLTDAARGISATNLSERIALAGPDDELKRLADTFDSMLERLELSFDSQRLFAAHASHELRTPLAVLRAEAELTRSTHPSADAAHLAEVTIRQADRADRLVGSLLALARAEGGALAFAQVDLADLVGEVVSEAAAAADAAGVTLDLELANAFVSGDAVLLRSLVSNLVANAISYNHSGGSVTITLTFDHAAKSAELVVNNTGRHLATDEVDNLIHPFARADIERQRVAGSGIGMAVVTAVAAAHHGSFAAQPRTGGGLVARVVLPAMDSHGT